VLMNLLVGADEFWDPVFFAVREMM